MTTDATAPPEKAATHAADNPYVGPRAFRLGERFFFGRERETRELADLLTAERVVILHAPSGSGKTSLIQAGLIPAMAADFDVLPVIRVGRPPIAGLPAHVNRYLFSTLVSLEALLPAENAVPTADWTELSVVNYLTKRAAAAAENKPQLLIFDQFEEMMTLDPYDQAAKDEFFGQLAEVLRRDRRAAGAAPARWALFALRDEFVAALTPYLRRLPVSLSEMYRLDLLGIDAAVEAVRRPAEQKGGVPFAEAAARKLVDNLRRIRLPQPAGSAVPAEALLGPYVEPVHLQVVCYRLWEQLQAHNRKEVREADINELADVDNALAGYYRDRVGEAAAKTGVGERVIRVWFEQQLITPDGRRAMVQPDASGDQALDARAVQELVNAFLVRREERRGLVWLELSHDRLIEPVRQDNARWLVDNLAKWQLRALEWARQGRPDKLLLAGVELGDAQSRKVAHPDRLSHLDEEYLDKSWSRATKTDQVKNYLYRGWAYIASTVCVALLGLVVLAFWLDRKAESERRIATKATADATDALDRANMQSHELEDNNKTLMSKIAELEATRNRLTLTAEMYQGVRAADTQKVRPVQPGTSVSHGATRPATICCVVKDKQGTRYLLGAVMTFAPPNAKKGDPIFQPATGDGGKPADAVAALERWNAVSLTQVNEGNGAIARLLPGVQALNQVSGFGPIKGQGVVRKGEPVVTIGRTSPFVQGVVEQIDENVKADALGREYVSGTFKELIEVKAQGKVPSFAAVGDLGAPVLTPDGKLVGMVYAKAVNGNTLVLPIGPILKALDVECDLLPTETSKR